MSGYLVAHFDDSRLSRYRALRISEPTVRRFFNAIEWLEEAYSQLPGFVETELIVD